MFLFMQGIDFVLNFIFLQSIVISSTALTKDIFALQQRQVYLLPNYIDNNHIKQTKPFSSEPPL